MKRPNDGKPFGQLGQISPEQLKQKPQEDKYPESHTEDFSAARVEGIIDGHIEQTDAMGKIIFVFKNDNEQKKNPLERLLDPRNSLLAKSGQGHYLDKVFRKEDYYLAYQALEKALKKISVDLQKLVDQNEKAKNPDYLLDAVSSLNREMLLQGVDKIFQPEARATVEGILFGLKDKRSQRDLYRGLFTKGKGVFVEMIIGIFDDYKKKNELTPENIKAAIADILDYCAELILQNLSNLRNNSFAPIVPDLPEDVSKTTNLAKLQIERFCDPVKYAPLLEEWVTEKRSELTQKDWVFLWRSLKSEGYEEILLDNKKRDEYARTIAGADAEKVNIIKDRLGMLAAAIINPKNIRGFADTRSWAEGRSVTLPLRTQVDMCVGLGDLYRYNTAHFMGKIESVLAAAQESASPEEQTIIKDILAVFNSKMAQERLENSSIADQRAVLQALEAKNWLELKNMLNNKFSKGRKVSSVKKEVAPKFVKKTESVKTEPLATKTGETVENKPVKKEKTEEERLAEREAFLNEIIDEMEKYFLEQGGDHPDYEKLMDDFSFPQEGNLKEMWENFLQSISDSQFGYVKGIVRFNKSLSDGTATEKMNKLREYYPATDEASPVDDMFEKYTDLQVFDGLFSFDEATGKYQFNGAVWDKGQKQMSALKKIMELAGHDLSTFDAEKLKQLIGANNEVNVELLKELLASKAKS